jgi:hypothetical protein
MNNAPKGVDLEAYMYGAIDALYAAKLIDEVEREMFKIAYY